MYLCLPVYACEVLVEASGAWQMTRGWSYRCLWAEWYRIWEPLLGTLEVRQVLSAIGTLLQTPKITLKVCQNHFNVSSMSSHMKYEVPLFQSTYRVAWSSEVWSEVEMSAGRGDQHIKSKTKQLGRMLTVKSNWSQEKKAQNVNSGTVSAL